MRQAAFVRDYLLAALTGVAAAAGLYWVVDRFAPVDHVHLRWNDLQFAFRIGFLMSLPVILVGLPLAAVAAAVLARAGLAGRAARRGAGVLIAVVGFVPLALHLGGVRGLATVSWSILAPLLVGGLVAGDVFDRLHPADRI